MKLNIDLDANCEAEDSLDPFDEANSQDNADQFIGVTHIHFPAWEPVGKMVVSFDDGTIKMWQTAVKNE